MSMQMQITISFLLFVALVVAVGFGYIWHNTAQANKAVNEWFGLLKKSQFEEAYSLTTHDFKQETSLQMFKDHCEVSDLIRASPGAWSHRQFHKGFVVLAGGMPMPNGYSFWAVYLVLDRGIWKVNGVKMSPMIGRQMRRFIDIDVNQPGFKIESSNSH